MIHVLGIGSPLGDDQAGWLVVHGLRGRVPDSVRLLTLDRPGASLINQFAGIDHLILVDALHCPDCHQPFRELGVADIDDCADMLSGHDLNLPQTLRLAATLDCLPRRIEILGVIVARPQRGAIGHATMAHARAAADFLAEKLADAPAR